MPVKQTVSQASPRRAVFAIHGFTGHPEEMRHLGEGVAKRMNATLALPAIAGHAATPELFADSTAEDWYLSIESAYDELAEKYDQVFVIGNSFGSNLALKLGRKRDPTAITCVSIPSLTKGQKIAFKAFLAAWRPFVGKYWTKPASGNLATEVIPGYTQLCYETIPLSTYHELIRFAATEMQPDQIAQVTQPTLFISATKDPIVPLSSAKWYYERVSSQQKKLLEWDDHYHMIVVGTRKVEMVNVVSDWFEKVAIDLSQNNLHD